MSEVELILRDPEKYKKLQREVLDLMNQEITSNGLMLQKEWLSTHDHIPENAIVVRGFPANFNNYVLYALMETAG